MVLTRFSRNEKTEEGEEDAQGVTMLLAALAVMATLFAAVAYEIILLNSVPVGEARKKEGSVLFRQYIAQAIGIAVLIILALLMLVPAALLLGLIVRTKGRK